MRDPFRAELERDLPAALRLLENVQQQRRSVAEVVIIIALAIIRPSPHKEKINSRARRERTIDELKHRIVRQSSFQIGGPAFTDGYIVHRRDDLEVIP